MEQRLDASWIDDGEKYAVVALAVELDHPLPIQQMTPHHWVFADERFEMPPHWREWLGTIRTEEVEGSNLFLLSKVPSQTPDNRNGENIKLTQRAMQFYSGLVLANRFALKHSPVMLSGGRHDGERAPRREQERDRVL